jgi:hypothetical protein
MQKPDNTPCCSKAFLIMLGTLGLLSVATMIAAALLFARMPVEATPMPAPLGQAAREMKVPTLAPNDQPGGDSLSERVKVHSSADTETLDTLKNENIPVNDPIELAGRVGGLSITPIFKAEMPKERVVGEVKPFWILDVDTNEYREVDARLIYATPHLYFWSENGIEVDDQSVAELSETFEKEIYPKTRQIFGSEWTPGVDHDPHLTILYASGLGGAAGYFSSTDSLTLEVEPYSNESEMFYLSADYTTPDSLYTYGVLAHEFQHMIHWNVDRNESSWVNEGLAELAVELNGYDTGSFTFFFAVEPDLQLNFWPGNDQGDSTPHYGASYLFMKYLMDRFGEDSIREFVANQRVGLESVDEVFSPKNPELGQGFTSEILFQDWSVANIAAGSGLPFRDLGYKDLEAVPSFFSSEVIACDSDWQGRSVNQFGSDYFSVDCPGSFRLQIEGGKEVDLLPVDPHSGDYYFWSNYGDSSDMTLSQTFDLRSVDGGVSLSYWTWFDIESDYDYLYLLASINGKDWELLKPDRCTNADPTGSNYGCGYNGKSNGWVQELVDLSPFAGSEVTLQFEYITDLAVNGDGLVIDDVSIEAINYFTDFEENEGGWDGQGFVRVKNTLPQNFGFSIVNLDSARVDARTISLGGLAIDQEFDQVEKNSVFVLNGLTRYTHIPADYRIRAISMELP